MRNSFQPGIETKGVASFRSAVTTLNTHRPPTNPPIKHSDFVRAVTKEFAHVYASKGKELETRDVAESRVQEEKVWKGVEELKSWEWTYGQSPEFSNAFEGDVSIGNIVSLGSSIVTHIPQARLPSTKGKN